MLTCAWAETPLAAARSAAASAESVRCVSVALLLLLRLHDRAAGSGRGEREQFLGRRAPLQNVQRPHQLRVVRNLTALCRRVAERKSGNTAVDDPRDVVLAGIPVLAVDNHATLHEALVKVFA